MIEETQEKEQIRNSELFTEIVVKSATLKKEIALDLNKRMGKLNKIFNLAFGKFETMNVFKLIKDMLFFKGGYPKIDSPAKIEVIVEKMANIIHFLNYMGMGSNLSALFNEFDIHIDFNSINSEKYVLKNGYIKKQAKLEQLWMETFGSELSNQMPKNELLNILLSEAVDLQDKICKKGDNIKVDNAETVESECDIKKKHFISGVNIICKQMMEKDIAGDLAKLSDDIEQAKSVIDTLV